MEIFERRRVTTMIEDYGKELILDLHDCTIYTFTRQSIRTFCEELCNLIDMEACEFHFWDEEDLPDDQRQTNPKTAGISAVQFILTSNITVHTLYKLGKCFINVFSCKEFDHHIAEKFAKEWFDGTVVTNTVIRRL